VTLKYEIQVAELLVKVIVGSMQLKCLGCEDGLKMRCWSAPHDDSASDGEHGSLGNVHLQAPDGSVSPDELGKR
jgi:hypothetical protein